VRRVRGRERDVTWFVFGIVHAGGPSYC
jgi:hypothetical protein